MVEEHRHIVLVALHDLLGKLRLLGSRIVAILETMALLVSLSHNIQSVLVAEIIPAWIVWIVAGTNGIDVHALHHHDVLNHALLTYVVALVRINLMTVGTLQENRLTIDQELLVLDLHLAETYLYLYNLVWQIHTAILDRRYYKGIEVRSLCTPLANILHTELILSHTILYIIGTSNDYLLAIRVVKTEVCQGITLHLGCDVEVTILIVVLQLCLYTDIEQTMILRTGIEIVLTCRTAQTPEVLILTP